MTGFCLRVGFKSRSCRMTRPLDFGHTNDCRGCNRDLRIDVARKNSFSPLCQILPAVLNELLLPPSTRPEPIDPSKKNCGTGEREDPPHALRGGKTACQEQASRLGESSAKKRYPFQQIELVPQEKHDEITFADPHSPAEIHPPEPLEEKVSSLHLE